MNIYIWEKRNNYNCKRKLKIFWDSMVKFYKNKSLATSSLVKTFQQNIFHNNVTAKKVIENIKERCRELILKIRIWICYQGGKSFWSTSVSKTLLFFQKMTTSGSRWSMRTCLFLTRKNAQDATQAPHVNRLPHFWRVTQWRNLGFAQLQRRTKATLVLWV